MGCDPLGIRNYRRDSHTIWDCAYHLVWVTKYRYPILAGDIGQNPKEPDDTSRLCRPIGRTADRSDSRRNSKPPPLGGGAFISISKLSSAGGRTQIRNKSIGLDLVCNWLAQLEFSRGEGGGVVFTTVLRLRAIFASSSSIGRGRSDTRPRQAGCGSHFRNEHGRQRDARANLMRLAGRMRHHSIFHPRSRSQRSTAPRVSLAKRGEDFPHSSA
jgi:hypothetical protein